MASFLVSWYQKGRTILDFNKARDDGWQWHQLDHTPDRLPHQLLMIQFLCAPSWCPTNGMMYTMPRVQQHFSIN